METVGIAGAGKDIILREALKGLNLDIIDIEQAFSEQGGAGVEWNCETALGCALMGLES
jgi:shikimate kinase